MMIYDEADVQSAHLHDQLIGLLLAEQQYEVPLKVKCHIKNIKPPQAESNPLTDHKIVLPQTTQDSKVSLWSLVKCQSMCLWNLSCIHVKLLCSAIF